MKANIIYVVLFFLLAAGLLPADSIAQTTCEVNNCKITITIKIAFSGATDAQIASWKKDIEDTWNGSGQTTGDCKCPVDFKVETMKITDPAQVNCSPPPQGYHCVMVTSFATNPPTDTRGRTYVGYMYPPGVARRGQGLKGWWSDVMNRPAPGGGIYHDAAHEAGHMLGLGDGDGDGLMTNTSGAKARPTQSNIDSAVANICGPNACPDRCCCGNGKVDADKGEGCDPMATPMGCISFQECCPVCCRCFIPQCDPAAGQYNTQAGCEINCTGENSHCYKNYKTGCWDCVKLSVVEHRTAYSISKVNHCDHNGSGVYDLLIKLVGYDFAPLPLECALFGTQWINLFVSDDGVFSIITFGCNVLEVNDFLIEHPSMNAFTDTATIQKIANGELTVEQAIFQGKITYEILK